jgi:hypothetical protein
MRRSRACRRVVASLSAAAVLVVLSSAGGAAASGRQAPADRQAHAAVIGGTPAAAGTLPWLALVQRDVSAGAAGALCTGVVIAPDAILTAAHCLVNPTTRVGYPPSDFEVGTGTVNIHDAKALQLSRVSALAVYPSRNYFGDAAVLILATPTSAPALPLATAADLRYMQAGTAVLSAGWGETRYGESNGSGGQLYRGVLVVQSAKYCQAQVKADDLVGFDAGEQLCAVDPKFRTTDCATLVAGDGAGNIELFDAASPSQAANSSIYPAPRTLRGDGNVVYAVAVSPDGRTLASGDSGGIMRLRDLRSEQPLGAAVTVGSELFDAAFAASDQLVTGAMNGEVVVWPALLLGDSLASFSQDLCPRLAGNLTAAQWQQYAGGQPYRATCPDLGVG